MPTAATPFVRDRLTYLNYLVLAVANYMFVIVGPVLPNLKSRFHLDYTMTGMAPATLALGMVVAGFISDRWIANHGARNVTWISAAAMSIGALGLAIPVVIVVFLNLFLIGVSGGTLLTITSAVLSQHHGASQAVAVVEANVVAAVSGLCAPAVMLVAESTGIGWQVPLAIPMLSSAALYWLFRNQDFPTTTRLPKGAGKTLRLARHYWICWLLLVVVVALESSLNVWGPQYFQNVVGLTKAQSLVGPVLFYAAFLVSRACGAVLIRRHAEVRLLLATLSITACGTFLYWAWPSPIPATLGFVIAGFGVANLWPLTLSVAIHAGKRQGLESAAAARASSAAGVSTVVFPLVLGSVADNLGLRTSQGVIVLIGVTGLFLLKLTTNGHNSHQDTIYLLEPTTDATIT